MICHKKEEADQNDDDVCVLNFGEEIEEKTDKLLQKFNSDFTNIFHYARKYDLTSYLTRKNDVFIKSSFLFSSFYD